MRLARAVHGLRSQHLGLGLGPVAQREINPAGLELKGALEGLIQRRGIVRAEHQIHRREWAMASHKFPMGPAVPLSGTAKARWRYPTSPGIRTW